VLGVGQRKPNPQQVARAGEHYVAAEIHRRGGYASTFAGNMPDIDILACDSERTRVVLVQVKTKGAKSKRWQSSIDRGHARSPEPESLRFWALVDLRSSPPDVYVIPEWWIENDIYESHRAYLAKRGGRRARNPDSKHHAITVARVAEWRGRWELLGIFDEPA
jgi:hypothetical protein